MKKALRLNFEVALICHDRSHVVFKSIGPTLPNCPAYPPFYISVLLVSLTLAENSGPTPRPVGKIELHGIRVAQDSKFYNVQSLKIYLIRMHPFSLATKPYRTTRESLRLF
jgi:hypothetical protein